MGQTGLHWTEQKRDSNLQRTPFFTLHTNRPRISSETILKLLTLKSHLLGTSLDILKEAQQFEAKNIE